jgi:hypothetical protein
VAVRLAKQGAPYSASCVKSSWTARLVGRACVEVEPATSLSLNPDQLFDAIGTSDRMTRRRRGLGFDDEPPSSSVELISPVSFWRRW